MVVLPVNAVLMRHYKLAMTDEDCVSGEDDFIDGENDFAARGDDLVAGWNDFVGAMNERVPAMNALVEAENDLVRAVKNCVPAMNELPGASQGAGARRACLAGSQHADHVVSPRAPARYWYADT